MTQGRRRGLLEASPLLRARCPAPGLCCLVLGRGQPGARWETARGRPGLWQSATGSISALGVCSPNHTVCSLLPTVMSSVKPVSPALKAALLERLSAPSPPCSATSLLSAALPCLKTSLSVFYFRPEIWTCDTVVSSRMCLLQRAGETRTAAVVFAFARFFPVPFSSRT